ncbi:MAG: hypothetical protein HY436_01500 [Candidatus Liptonbacteria bacterium]|nr:hypothetical protein [Candidatus Liptonbacteria bacterium]
MAAAITIKSRTKQDGSVRFLVQVTDERSTAEYAVVVEMDFWDRLFNNSLFSAEKRSFSEAGAEALVRKSFEFLLAREPKEAILSSFNLREITGYFPSYEDEIRQMR